MRRLVRLPANIAAIAMRAALFSLALAAPVLAVPSVSGGQGMTIEAPGHKNNGVGFVILLALQR